MMYIFHLKDYILYILYYIDLHLTTYKEKYFMTIQCDTFCVQ